MAVSGWGGLGLLLDCFPPRQTIGSRLERWVRLGVLDRALAVPNGCLRLARGRNRRPSAGILDTQSVGAGPQAGPRGYDANKKIKGRKRVLLADTEGLLQALRVVPASVQGADGHGHPVQLLVPSLPPQARRRQLDNALWTVTLCPR